MKIIYVARAREAYVCIYNIQIHLKHLTLFRRAYLKIYRCVLEVREKTKLACTYLLRLV